MTSLTRFVRRGTVRIAYEPPNPTGTRLLALHDLLADRRAYASLTGAPGLALLAVDLRGHGASAALADHRFVLDDLVYDLLALLDAEAWETTAVAGDGVGAAIALRLASLVPHRVTTLVLRAPALWDLPQGTLDEPERKAIEARRTADVVAAREAYGGRTVESLDRFMSARHGQKWADELPPEQVATARRSRDSLTRLLPALADVDLGEQSLSRVTSPVILIADASLDTAQIATTRVTAEALPQATIWPICAGDWPEIVPRLLARGGAR